MANRSEYATETYSDNETIIVDNVSEEYNLAPLFHWMSADLSFKGLPYMRYYAYDMPDLQQYDNARIKVSVWDQMQYEQMVIRVFDMTRTGHIYAPDAYNADVGTPEGQIKWIWITGKSTTPWLDSANSMINGAKFLGGRTNIWSKPDNPHVLEYDIGKARNIAVIISGPQNSWNANTTVSLMLNRTQTEDKTVTRERKVLIQTPYEVQKQRDFTAIKQVPFWELLFSK
ncbi:MAG: hypothetical protein NT082_07985 [Chloroflexi bacterium]|nr:hypothetical protein [Chloroflexota bacterium]